MLTKSIMEVQRRCDVIGKVRCTGTCWHTGVEMKWLTRSVANSNAMLVGILDFDIVVTNSIVAVNRASSFCQCLKQGAIPLLQSTQGNL